MRSPTYGELTFAQIAGKIASYIMAHGLDRQYELSVGTDSQNFDDTKMVCVVTLHDVGHGGIFFYDVRRMRKIMNSCLMRQTPSKMHSVSISPNTSISASMWMQDRTVEAVIPSTKFVAGSVHVDTMSTQNRNPMRHPQSQTKYQSKRPVQKIPSGRVFFLLRDKIREKTIINSELEFF